MRVLVSGATGLIGSAVVHHLEAQHHAVVRLARVNTAPQHAAVVWGPAKGVLDPVDVDGFDAVVHLAGENIAGRWTTDKKRKIRDSRIMGTRLLSEVLAQTARPPQVLVCASAIGYYGDQGDTWLTESSPAGNGFLADVCRGWEAATVPASEAGIRVVNTRFGVVLSDEGGALKSMLTPFSLGLGGVVGGGGQYMSWIGLEDTARAVVHALNTESLTGPVNVVAPHPVTNREFTKALGRAMSRPTLLPMPAFAVRLVFGEMGEALLLASTRVKPEALERSGFTFHHPELQDALGHVLLRPQAA